jgi:hypothetical protein
MSEAPRYDGVVIAAPLNILKSSGGPARALTLIEN